MSRGSNQAIPTSSLRIFKANDERYSVHVLLPGERLCFFGAAAFQCLAGEVSIDWYNLKCGSFEPNSMDFVCAPYRLGRPAVIFATPISDVLGLNYKSHRLKYRLKTVTKHYESILALIGDRQAAVLVMDRKPRRIVDCIAQLPTIGDFFIPEELRNENYHSDHAFLYADYKYRLYDEPSHKGLNETITKMDAKRNEGKRCVVVPCAGKGAGKSTLVRHFVNRSLNNSELPVYVLDADLGQTEWTPPGCMSLRKVIKPLLDIPQTHQERTFGSCYFFGDISPANEPKRYRIIFNLLYNEFVSSAPPGSVVVINTMGWIEGLGLDLLRHIFEISRPTIAILMPSAHGFYAPPLWVPRVVTVRPNEAPGVYKPAVTRILRKPRKLSAPQLRDLTIIGYFADMLPRPVLSSFNEIPPFRLCFKDALLAIPEDYSYVRDEYMLSSMNAQIVALCTADDDVITAKSRRLLGKSWLPHVMLMSEDTEPLKCLGFGIVRGVDLEQMHIYVSTPLQIPELNQVRILARGTDLFIPQTQLAAQACGNIPYLSRPSRNSHHFIDDLFASLKSNSNHQKRGHYPQAK